MPISRFLTQPVLTAAQTRSAEEAVFANGTSPLALMREAGRAAAEWVWRVAGGRAVTVLCGPGNNGGDGFVLAEHLRRRRTVVTVVAPLQSGGDVARQARADYRGVITTGLPERQGGVFVDCLFGIGLDRPLEAPLAALLGQLHAQHPYRVAIDLPSNCNADSGELYGADPLAYDLTLACGVWKPAHWLMPASATMGEKRLMPLGLSDPAGQSVLALPPRIAPPAADAHKYTRGLVLVVEGAMPGAARLAAVAAQRAGAGYVRLMTEASPGNLPWDIPAVSSDAMSDDRTGTVLAGPGLGRGDDARRKLDAAFGTRAWLMLDADALHLLAPADRERIAGLSVLTPHDGELAILCRTFGVSDDNRPARALALAAATGCYVLAKGPDTLLAAPDGNLTHFSPATAWLSVAGSGDVLAGIVAARLAVGREPGRAITEAVFLHGASARLAGPAFGAQTLAQNVSSALRQFL